MGDVDAIIIDSGSETIKAGFAGEDAPRAVFPSIVGRLKTTKQIAMMGMVTKDTYIGSEAQSKRGILSLQKPIEQRIVTHWEDMEELWTYTFYNELRAAPEEAPVLLTESPTNPKANREKTAQMMLETFQVPSLFLARQALLSMYASGRNTGIVLDSGSSTTHAVPVYNGFPIPYLSQQLDLTGTDLTDFMMKMLSETGYNLSSEREIVCDIKETLAYVALDLNAEKEKRGKTVGGVYELPMGQVIEPGSACFRCPEALFQPSLIGKSAIGIHELLFDCIRQCDPEIQPTLFRNIVLSGGNTLFSGLQERLTHEVHHLTTREVRVIAPTDRKYATWIGGSIMASLTDFQQMWITKEEYDEIGSWVISRKCLF